MRFDVIKQVRLNFDIYINVLCVRLNFHIYINVLCVPQPDLRTVQIHRDLTVSVGSVHLLQHVLYILF